MSNDVLAEPFDALKRGAPEAYRYYFNLHCYRIYYYLLRQTRNAGFAKTLSQNAFVAFFKSNVQLLDEDHLLRRLYLIARVSFLLYNKGLLTADDLLKELAFYTQDEPDLMDDPEVTRNESLLTLQRVLQRLSPHSREIAELFFFQEQTAKAIAIQLGINEQNVREHLSDAMQRLDLELSSKKPSYFYDLSVNTY